MELCRCDIGARKRNAKSERLRISLQYHHRVACLIGYYVVSMEVKLLSNYVVN